MNTSQNSRSSPSVVIILNSSLMSGHEFGVYFGTGDSMTLGSSFSIITGSEIYLIGYSDILAELDRSLFLVSNFSYSSFCQFDAGEFNPTRSSLIYCWRRVLEDFLFYFIAYWHSLDNYW